MTDNLRTIWTPEDTAELARAMAMHPATLHQPERQTLATVTELRTRERR